MLLMAAFLVVPGAIVAWGSKTQLANLLRNVHDIFVRSRIPFSIIIRMN
jgi:hypothetical protein